MKNMDTLHRFIFENSSVRGEYIHLMETYQTIVNQHNYPPPIQQLLGEALAVVGLLAAIVKFDGRITLQFRGKGKLKLLLVQCESNFTMRGLVKWDGAMNYDTLMKSFEEGTLAIILKSGDNNEYQGIVKWQGKTLAESIESYFKLSEQLDTKIWLAVNDNVAAGLLLQFTPEKEVTTLLEPELKKFDWESITTHTDNHLKSIDLLRLEFQSLLKQLFPRDTIRIFEASEVAFACTCNRTRSEFAISLLGEAEANAELKDKQVIVVTCDFCNKTYNFDRVDIAKIFKDKITLPKDQLH